MTEPTTVPADAAATPEGRFPGFETIEEWVAFEHGWKVCDYCGETGEHVRPEIVHVGGHGDQQRFRCTVADARIGWRYGGCVEVA